MKIIPVKIKVTRGRVIVNSACVHKRSRNIMLVEIDLKSKYAQVYGYGDFCVALSADEHTLHVDKRKNPESLTSIEFPEFKDWSIYLSSVGRYTLSLCLVKNRKQRKEK